MRDFQAPGRGQYFKAQDVADQLAELRRIGKLTVEGGTVTDGPSGKHIVLDRTEGFWAVLGDRPTPGTGQYSWREVALSLTGTNWYYPDKQQMGYYGSDPAIEANFNGNIPYGTVVWLHRPVTGVPRGDGHIPQFYVFDYSASAPFISGSGQSGSGSGSGGSGSGSGASGSVTSGSAVSGSVASGSAVSGSVASGSVVSGSAASGSVESGSVASGSAVSGSVASGSVVSGSAASGSVASGSAASGSAGSGSAGSGVESGSGASGGSGLSGSAGSGSGSGISGSGVSGSVSGGSGAGSGSGGSGGGSGGSGACGGSGALVIEVVTGVSCVNGAIVVTKQQISIPGGVLC
jgi:hypothetical protein